MKRPLVAIALACIAVLAIAAPCSAYTPPETDPRIVMTTSEGQILIALAPENAPRHVAEFLTALTAGDFAGSQVARVQPQFYVQIVGKLGKAQLAGLPIERIKVGNLHGALSVYDSGKQGDVPTLTFVLVSSPQLDTDYTSIGFVESGSSILQKMAATPTIGDHQPTKTITISEIHIATTQERSLLREAEKAVTSQDASTSQLAAIFIIACAAFVAAMISAFHDRLTKQRMTSLALLVALLSFFAVWVALGGTNQGSGLAGVALFCGAIAIFRLMGRFERPAQVAGQPPPATAAAASDELATTSPSTTMSNQ